MACFCAFPQLSYPPLIRKMVTCERKLAFLSCLVGGNLFFSWDQVVQILRGQVWRASVAGSHSQDRGRSIGRMPGEQGGLVLPVAFDAVRRCGGGSGMKADWVEGPLVSGAARSHRDPIR